jgi:hypothetical protein
VRRIRGPSRGRSPRRTDRPYRRRDDDREGRACPAVPQPDAVPPRLSARDARRMVFDAHDKAFAFFGGACARGIYDSVHCPPLVRGQWTRRRRWTRSSSAVTAHTTGASSRCAGTTSSSRSPAPRPRDGRRVRSRTRWASCDGGSSCRGRASRPMPSSTPGSRTAASPGPRRTRIRSCATRRSGRSSRMSHCAPLVQAQWRMRASLVPYVGPFDGFHAVPALDHCS